MHPCVRSWLPNQHDSWAHLEATCHFTLIELNFSFVALIQSRIHKVLKRTFLILRVGFIEEIRIPGHNLISAYIGVEIKLNRSNVKCADIWQKEKQTLRAEPVAKDVNSFIVFKHISVILDVSGLHWREVSRNVSSEASCVNSRRVETVIITRWEVDDHIRKLVATILNSLQQSFNTRVISAYFTDSASAVLISVVTNHTHHEFVKTVRTAFDAVDRAVSAVYSARGQNSPIAGRAKRERITLIVYLTRAWFESSCEKVSESSVFRILSCCFLNLNSINKTEKAEKRRS